MVCAKVSVNTDQELSDLMVEAYTRQKQGELSLAIQSWNALASHPSGDSELKANAHLNLGHLHQQQGNNDLAHESMANAIAANPNSAEAYFCLAYLAQEKESFEEAIGYFESALDLNKDDAGAYNNLANCYDRLNKNIEADRKSVV
jgi:tetratricopeptide (TPR) repeat protein